MIDTDRSETGRSNLRIIYSSEVMPPTQSTRIEFAAHFTAKIHDIFLLQREYKSSSYLFIKIIRKPLNYWESAYPYLAYWGPVQTEKGEEQIQSLLSSINQPNNDFNQVKKILKEILETYELESLGEEDKGKSSIDLISIITNANLKNFVDGNKSANSEKILTLSSAQNLGEKVRASAVLSDHELGLAKILLTKAPLVFGFWGPFKTLLKFMDPKILPKEFGQALGRLSLHNGFNLDDTKILIDTENPECENLFWLTDIVPSPSSFTIQYMLRRMRRNLAKIGDKDFKTYSIVAAHMLISWDSHIDKTSFIPAYILCGTTSILDQRSRFVKVPLQQEVRHDPHSEAWNNNLSLVKKILNSITVSSEILTFCFQIFLGTGEKLPPLKKKSVLLALQSRDPEIVEIACKSVPDHPNIYKDMTSLMWWNFFSSSDLNSLTLVIKQLLSCPVLKNSINEIIDGTKELLIHPSCIKNISDLSPVALLYLKYISKDCYSSWIQSSGANSRAIEAIAYGYQFEELDDIYMALISKMTTADKLSAYLRLVEADSVCLVEADSLCKGNIKVLSEIIMDSESLPIDDTQRIQLAMECFQSKVKTAIDLGWLFIDNCANWLDTQNLLWEELKKYQASKILGKRWSTHRLQVIKGFLERSSNLNARFYELMTDSSWHFALDNTSSYLKERAHFIPLFWQALGHDECQYIKDIIFKDSKLLIAVGDTIRAEQLATSSSHQQEMLLQYIRLNSARIKAEPMFGIGLVKTPNPILQESALIQLKQANLIEKYWMTIAEIGLPLPLETIHQFINSITIKRKFTEYVISCIDSVVASVRDMGLEFLDQKHNRIDDDYLWPALAESDDPKVQSRVAERTLIKDWYDSPEYDAFDRRLLITRRVNRKAKEQVKLRINRSTKSKGGEVLTPEREKALLDLTKGANSRDRAWALRNIAILMLKGASFNEMQIKTETGVRN